MLYNASNSADHCGIPPLILFYADMVDTYPDVWPISPGLLSLLSPLIFIFPFSLSGHSSSNAFSKSKSNICVLQKTGFCISGKLLPISF